MKFIESNACSADYQKYLSHEKWLLYFNSFQNSELLIICQFFFALPAQNASVERIFSQIQIQWTKERNRLKTSTVKSIAMITYNFKDMNCKEFYKSIIDNADFLKSVQSSDKYTSDDEEDGEEEMND